MKTRRSFLAGLGLASLFAAPAIVRASSLMRVRSIAPKPVWVSENLIALNGAALSRSAYPELFAAIGTTHGSGNGVTTFNVPNTGEYEWVLPVQNIPIYDYGMVEPGKVFEKRITGLPFCQSHSREGSQVQELISAIKCRSMLIRQGLAVVPYEVIHA